MKQGDIVIIEFPFSNLTSKKIRPAVVLSNETYNKHKNVILAGIYGKKKPCSVALGNDDLTKKKLTKASFISLQNVFSLERSLVGRTVDTLQPSKKAVVVRALHAYVS